ncbi:MAG: hypothetical protein R6V30_07680, partial [Paracoccaceae bacterium]
GVHIDPVDDAPESTTHATTLNDGVDDIAPEVWSYMQDKQDDLPDPEIPDKRKGFFGALFGG